MVVSVLWSCGLMVVSVNGLVVVLMVRVLEVVRVLVRVGWYNV